MPRLARAAGLIGAAALVLPAAASAHPSWYFINAKIAKKPELQTLSSPSATWKPSAGATTIAGTATAAEVQSALQADTALVAGTPGYDNVRVTGTAGGPYTVTFVGTLAGVDVPPLTASGATVGTTQNGGANVTYSGDPAADQAAMADQEQAVVVNDGYTFGFRETNGVGPGGGMLNLSKFLPSSYRSGMTVLQKLQYAPAQTGIQVHASCGGVAALSDPANIAQVWDRASDHDPFYNYIPWQKDSAGLGDNPSQWIGVVKDVTGVDLSTVSDFAGACNALGGTYHPSDTRSTTASAAIADAVAPLNAQITTLNGQVSSLTDRVGSLVPQLTAANAKLAALGSARALKLTLTGRRLAPDHVIAMVTGPAGAQATVTIKVSSAVAKALKLSSPAIATAKHKLDGEGAALVSLSAKKAVIKALARANGAVPATVTVASGSESATATAKLTR